MNKPIASLAFLVALLAIAVPAAFAKIVPNQSIAGIELLMNRAEVIDAAGEPDKERIRDHEIVGRQRIMKYGKTKVSFSGKRPNSEVISILTRDPDEETKQGVGVGSKKRAIVRRLNGFECERELGFHHCFKGKFKAGERVTDFILDDDNRAMYVVVGIVID